MHQPILGAKHVYLVYRRSEAEMPAQHEEVEHAKEEGIDFRLLHNPVQYIGNDEGRVVQMECLRMALGEPDASSRRSPVPIQDSEFRLDVESRKGTIKTNLETMRTSRQGGSPEGTSPSARRP